jgi:hypothetical protein
MAHQPIFYVLILCLLHDMIGDHGTPAVFSCINFMSVQWYNQLQLTVITQACLKMRKEGFRCKSAQGCALLPTCKFVARTLTSPDSVVATMARICAPRPLNLDFSRGYFFSDNNHPQVRIPLFVTGVCSKACSYVAFTKKSDFLRCLSVCHPPNSLCCHRQNS